MLKSIPLGAKLLCMAALIGAGPVAAGAGGMPASLAARQPTAIRALASVTTNFTELALPQWLAQVGAAFGLQSTQWGQDVPGPFLPTIGSNAAVLFGADGDDKDNDKDHDRDRDRDHDRDRDRGHDKDKGQPKGPSPTPEPSTFLSFGAAIVIGGGVYFLGRLRKVQK